MSRQNVADEVLYLRVAGLDLGKRFLLGDHHLRRDPDRARHRAVRSLNQLGYTVTLNPIQGAV